jgi:hypothetical protein
MASAQVVTFTGSQAVNFGSVNVCPSGQSTPAPCSKTLTLTYNVTGSGTLGTPQVLTTGAPGLDFTLASGSTCTGSVTVGNTCTVNVAFAPLGTGLRKGGVEIVDGSGNVLANTYIYGSGVGPAIGFDPPMLRSLPLPPPPPYPGGNASSSVAVDGSGNLFLTNGNKVIEMLAVHGSIPANPTIKTLGSGFSNPVGLALDGSGNVFVADNGNEAVEEILAAGGYTTVNTLASGEYPNGISADGSGNVFFGVGRGDDVPPQGAVKEIVAVNGAIPANPTIQTLGGGFNAPQSVAVDGNGNVFVVDVGDPYPFCGCSVLKEILAVNGSIPANPTVNTLAIGDVGVPVAVDGNGNVFVVENNSNDVSTVKELVAVNGSIPANPTVNALKGGNSGLVDALALDGSGNLFGVGYPDYFAELQRSQPPSLSFAPTTPGYTSIDSPQSVRVQNIGNASLTGTAPSVSLNWDLVAGSGTPEDCTAGFSLTPGAECNLSISFEPTEDGPLTGAVTLEDNHLNATAAAQSIGLSGTGAAPSITGVSANYGAFYAIIALTGTNFGTSQGSRTVTFNGASATAYAWSDTTITVSVPGAATSGNIVVTADGLASNGVEFTVEPTLSVTGINPTSGPVGTVVTISGQNLLDAEGHGRVWLYSQAVPILSQSNTSIQVKVPAGATSGAFDVHINGVGTYTPVFTVPGTPTAPGLTGVSPRYGAFNAMITLTGTNFGAVQGSSTVTFTRLVTYNGEPSYFVTTAVPTAWSNTSITLPVPYGAGTGDLLVTAPANTIVVNVGQRASNGASFFVEPRPSITGMTPTNGPVGTVVTISGQNLLDGGGHGSVWFGNIKAPIVTQSSTSIQVNVPAGATTGPIDLHINGVGNYTPIFTVAN